jgi:hypothetical protein
VIDQFLNDLASAVTFLVHHARDPNDDPRQARDKIRKRLLYAIEKGELLPGALMIVSDEGALPAPEFITWARTKWPSEFNAFPALIAGITQSSFNVGDKVLPYVYPGDIPRCHDALRDAYRINRELSTQVGAALVEIDRLQPIEAKYVALCEKNRQNAMRPRKE